MIYPKPYLRGKYYYFKYTDSSGKRRPKALHTDKKGEAQKIIREFMDKQRRGSIGDMSFKDFLSPWKNGTTNPRYERYKTEGLNYGISRVKDISYLLANLDGHKILKLPAASITRGQAIDLREWLLTDKLVGKPRTVNKLISALKSIYSEAIYRDELDYNPFHGISDVRYKQTTKNVLSVSDVKQLLNRSSWRSETAWRFASFIAYTGMRFSEVAAMDWIQISGDVLNINRAFKTDGPDVIGLPKWDKTREIPLSKIALSMVRNRGIGLVFTENGHRIYHKWFSNELNIAIKSAKVERITPHSFRHILNSRLLLTNTSPYLIQRYMGWTNNSMLTKVQEGYTHISPDDLRVVANAVDEIFTSTLTNVSTK